MPAYRTTRSTSLPPPEPHWLGHVSLSDARPLKLSRSAAAGLVELAATAGGTPQDWAHRVVFQHLHGRWRLEQVWSRLPADKPGDAFVLPAALAADLARVAEASGETADTYASACIVEELNGCCPAVANADLTRDDAGIKVRLPERLVEVIAGLQRHLDLTQADVLRDLLLIHLVGRLAYERLTRAGAWHARRRPNEGGYDAVMFSEAPSDAPRTRFIRAHGKSTAAIRVWLPAAMRDAVLAEAEEADLAASEYARRALVVDLLGVNAK